MGESLAGPNLEGCLRARAQPRHRTSVRGCVAGRTTVNPEVVLRSQLLPGPAPRCSTSTGHTSSLKSVSPTLLLYICKLSLLEKNCL